MSKPIKKITEEEYEAHAEKERAGEKLTKAEIISMFVFNGMSPAKAKEAYYVTRQEYGKPDKDGIVTIV